MKILCTIGNMLLLLCGLATAQDVTQPQSAESTQSNKGTQQQKPESDPAQNPVPPNSTTNLPAQTAPAQAVTPPPAVEKKPVFYLEVGGSVAAVDNGYGTWKGTSLKLGYTGSTRFSPFLGISSQTRPEGSQPNFGLGSYITLSKRFYTVVGISGTPDNGVVLWPLVRYGATLLGAVPKVKGLVASVGFTDLRFSTPGGGEIYSVGTIYYHGRLILSGGANFNRDRLSGAISESGQAGFMYGTQGKYWIGAGMSGGTEAYQVYSAVPFDARFKDVGNSAFIQKWLTKRHGFILRYDYGNKLTAYQLHGVSAALFFSF